jgi:hypothetical protein
MVYEKLEYYLNKKDKLWNKWHFVENKTAIMQHVLKMQYISFLSKYTKLILNDSWPCTDDSLGDIWPNNACTEM